MTVIVTNDNYTPSHHDWPKTNSDRRDKSGSMEELHQEVWQADYPDDSIGVQHKQEKAPGRQFDRQCRQPNQYEDWSNERRGRTPGSIGPAAVFEILNLPGITTEYDKGTKQQQPQPHDRLEKTHTRLIGLVE